MTARRAGWAAWAAAAAALALLVPGARASAGGDHLAARAPLGVEAAAADSYVTTVTIGNLVGITISNYGFVGNNFVSRQPSFEYPLGTGYEHMVRGGLWIGAHAIDDNGPFIGVSTATVDGSQGTSSQGASEFSPVSSQITVRSTLASSRFYDPKAVSELDYITSFSDKKPVIVDNSTERHRPMQLRVRQINYSWSFSEFQHFVVFHYVIINDGPPLDSVWVGFYSELASGPKNAYSGWPPRSATGGAAGSWFGKKWVAYDDTLRLIREHYCAQAPVPAGCNLPFVPYWAGIKLLTPPDTTRGQKVTFDAWNYAPGSTLRDEDVERYALMSAGTIEANPDSLAPPADPVELLAVGPFVAIDPGDSISVDFALMGGAEIPDIRSHAQFAQRAFDRDYVVPVPPPSPLLHVVARNHTLDFYWDDSPESAVDPTSPVLHDFEGYRLYLGEDRVDLHRIAQFDEAAPPHDTTGFNTGFADVRLPQPVTIDGVTYQYKYTVTGLKDGFKYFAAATAYDLGSVEIESLESGQSQNKTLAIASPAPGEEDGNHKITVFPNPYRVEARWDQGTLVRDHYLWFANLPERCLLKIYTLSGDLVFEVDFDGATYHGEGARGIYDPQRELDVSAPTLSGATYGWNMITREGQAAATGLYLFSVEDRATGKRTVGKFLIVKSDREGF